MRSKTIKLTSLIWMMLELVLAFCAMIALPGQPLFVATVCLFVFVFGMYLSNASENIFLLCFLATFFVFLLGRPVAETVFGKVDIGIRKLTTDASKTMYISLLISMIGIVVGYNMPKVRLTSKERGNRVLLPTTNTALYRVCSRKITRFLSIVLYFLVAIENYDRLAYVLLVGYTESFATYSSSVPRVIHMLAEEAPFAFAAYLATLPSKKDIRTPIFVFLTAMVIKMITGYRYEIVSAVLLLALYFIMRNRIDGEETWIRKGSIVTLIFLIPITVIGLQFMIYLRAGKDLVWAPESNPIVDFLYGVGGSSSLIGYADMYKQELSGRGFFYSFGRVWDAIAGNFLLKNITNVTIYSTQTVEKAQLGHSLGDALTYMLYPSRYLAGYGMGSCYIADLFYDFSYVGVFVGNYVIGRIIKKLKSLTEDDFVRNFLCLFLTTMLFRISRDTADYFLVEFIGVKNIAFVIGVHLMTLDMMRRKRGNGEDDS